MPRILESPCWEPKEVRWSGGAECAVARITGWRAQPAEPGWTRPVRPRTPSAGGRPSGRPSQVRLEVEFENLADEWEQATDFESVVARKVMHPAYQRIIGMGHPAVPLILRRLKREPRQWFWALTSITGEDPAQGETTADGAAQAWLEWGRRQGVVLA